MGSEFKLNDSGGDFPSATWRAGSASGGRGAGATLIAVENANAFGRPAPGGGALPEIGLHLSRFAMALHLLRMRLADIDDGPTFEMLPLDFRGSVRGRAPIDYHRPPPFRRFAWRREGVAAASASAGQPRAAEPRPSGTASGGATARWQGSATLRAGGRCRSKPGSGHGSRSSLQDKRCWHHRASSRRAAAHTTGCGEGVTRRVV